ncbi:DUF4905 domain-containing protein [Adhaeribacter sp. BT258]|uniref:DUF4905 domain-containing protein n=1 Tax=Adhaeribacter terrigena TaxID=2793070 RepID=A0ABS1BZD0_9BACT|nr:DUF4905 domain-containing protein [Adhaeribacter terrigena]MBK0402520.1 DUF4905 domain-containing protein [Adhaeribacter terrigena]
MLQRHFFYAFEGAVWKICPDQETQHMVLEIRQKDTLQTTFSVVDTRTGNLLLNNYKSTERWWTGLENALGGNMLLHGYSPNRETGKHLGITAVWEASGETRWHKPDLTFLGLHTEKALLAENASGQVKEIALECGAENDFFQERAYAKSRVQAFEEKRSRAMQFPVPYLPTDAHYSLLQRFLEQKTGRLAEAQIEYLETGNHIMLSFYARNPGVLANYLVVCSAAGEVLLEICLEPEVAGFALDTFFIFASKLFFIQEKTGLACYLL